MKNGKQYVPSPKPPKKVKNKKKKVKRPENVELEDHMVVDDQDGAKGKTKGAEFGMELTNTESPNKSKRHLDSEIDSAQTPLKRQKRAANIAVDVESDDEDEWVPSAPTRKSKRKAIT